MNNDIMRAVGFDEEVDRVEAGKCPFCGEVIDFNFRDGASLKEYRISGLCQTCQDSVFGGGLDE